MFEIEVIEYTDAMADEKDIKKFKDNNDADKGDNE